MAERKLTVNSEGFHRADKLDIDSIGVLVPPSPPSRDTLAKSTVSRPIKSFSPSKKGLSSPHWSTTAEGALLSRATTTVYRKIISPAKDGGLKVTQHAFPDEVSTKFIQMINAYNK